MCCRSLVLCLPANVATAVAGLRFLPPPEKASSPASIACSIGRTAKRRCSCRPPDVKCNRFTFMAHVRAFEFQGTGGTIMTTIPLPFCAFPRDLCPPSLPVRLLSRFSPQFPRRANNISVERLVIDTGQNGGRSCVRVWVCGVVDTLGIEQPQGEGETVKITPHCLPYCRCSVAIW